MDAVMASGAVPGVWPPVLTGGRPYIDGGFYATENADLALGFERVLILALRADNPPTSVVSLESALETLRGNGVTVEAVHPDSATESAIAAAGGPTESGGARAGSEGGPRTRQTHCDGAPAGVLEPAIRRLRRASELL
jgi:NTE family protein